MKRCFAVVRSNNRQILVDAADISIVEELPNTGDDKTRIILKNNTTIYSSNTLDEIIDAIRNSTK